MPARLAVEELRPAREVRRERARARRRMEGGRVLATSLKLEPRDAGGIFDLALEGLLARFGPSMAVALLLWIPFRQVAELLGVSAEASFEGMFFALGWNLLEVVPRALSQGVVIRLVVDALEDRRTPPAASLRAGLVRAPAAILVVAVTQFALLPLAFLVVPYLIAQWLTWAALPVLVLEGDALLTSEERARERRSPLAWLLNVPRRAGRALARSVRLSVGWPAFGRWFLLFMVGLVLLAGLANLGVVAVSYPPARETLRELLGLRGASAELVLGTFAAVLTAVAACVQAALMAAYYLDLRVRREGWDLELRLRRAGEET